jgi:hypothetical protein
MLSVRRGGRVRQCIGTGEKVLAGAEVSDFAPFTNGRVDIQ